MNDLVRGRKTLIEIIERYTNDLLDAYDYLMRNSRVLKKHIGKIIFCRNTLAFLLKNLTKKLCQYCKCSKQFCNCVYYHNGRKLLRKNSENVNNLKTYFSRNLKIVGRNVGNCRLDTVVCLLRSKFLHADERVAMLYARYRSHCNPKWKKKFERAKVNFSDENPYRGSDNLIYYAFVPYSERQSYVGETNEGLIARVSGHWCETAFTADASKFIFMRI